MLVFDSVSLILPLRPGSVYLWQMASVARLSCQHSVPSNIYNLISICSPYVQAMTPNSASCCSTLNCNLDDLFRRQLSTVRPRLAAKRPWECCFINSCNGYLPDFKACMASNHLDSCWNIWKVFMNITEVACWKSLAIDWHFKAVPILDTLCGLYQELSGVENR